MTRDEVVAKLREGVGQLLKMGYDAQFVLDCGLYALTTLFVEDKPPISLEEFELAHYLRLKDKYEG